MKPWSVASFRGNPIIRRGDTDIAEIRWNGHNEIHGMAEAYYLVRAANYFPRLIEALKGTLFLFEVRATNKSDQEQIQFARALLRELAEPESKYADEMLKAR